MYSVEYTQQFNGTTSIRLKLSDSSNITNNNEKLRTQKIHKRMKIVDNIMI